MTVMDSFQDLQVLEATTPTSSPHLEPIGTCVKCIPMNREE